jgi:hypothetical protein
MSLGACSGDNASPGGGGTGGGGSVVPSGPVPSNSFATSFASTFCDSIAACCRQAGYDPSSCRATLEPLLTASANLRLSSPNVVYDEVVAANCLNAERAALVACTDQNLADQVENACTGLFRGTVPEGGSCGESYECATPASGYVTCNAGVCTGSPDEFPGDMAHAAAGQACGGTCSGDANGAGCSGSGSSTTAACWIQDGLYCSNDVCVAVPAIGQPCGGGSYCVAEGHCESGTCVADIATGPCTSSDGCVSTSYCDFDTRQCTPLKANGAACNIYSECVGGQCEADRCRTWSIATAASCAGLLDD